MMEPKRTRRCPICGKGPLVPSQRFCSERCATIDLGRWLSGDYAIPAEEEPPEDEGGGGQG
ncbi:DNA gyrase inhibitor YacG [Falsiroseomonas oryzae]|uniref:DNA gyrase inhibitor YacG n=1 Tax=Falsiroseomonas oryzae TaxID=2766473 RepID=UPI0022EAC30E|nr:DNA gyrase inhibitor YacG [Roseomonas sp. MO-31]